MLARPGTGWRGPEPTNQPQRFLRQDFWANLTVAAGWARGWPGPQLLQLGTWLASPCSVGACFWSLQGLLPLGGDPRTFALRGGQRAASGRSWVWGRRPDARVQEPQDRSPSLTHCPGPQGAHGAPWDRTEAAEVCHSWGLSPSGPCPRHPEPPKK